jgi:hypothetical protein
MQPALQSTQPLTETSTRNLSGSKGRTVRKADNLIVIYEASVSKMWDPRRLIALYAFTLLRGWLYSVRTSQETPTGLHGLLQGEL